MEQLLKLVELMRSLGLKPLIWDIETDGLLDELTRIHTIHTLDTETGERRRYNDGFFADGSPAANDGSIADGLEVIRTAPFSAGHNIIAFDIPAIQKVVGSHWEPEGVTIDTLVACRYQWPEIKKVDQKSIFKKRYPPEFTGKLIGSHSMKAWGFRLGVLKADYEGEWHSFTQEMEEYAAQDPVTNAAIWDKIVSKDPSWSAILLECAVQTAIAAQERYGFKFNDVAAEGLERVLRMRRAELYDQLVSTFGSWWEPERKHGKVVEMVPARNDKKLHRTKGEAFSKVKLVTFNPASRDHIAKRLKLLFGWTPVEFTPSGAPEVSETTLASLDHIPEAALLIDYLTVEKRLGQLADGKQAWRRKVSPDGRIHGRINILGAITRRMTHSDPNMGQVPSLKNAKGVVPYGAECRGLFCVDEGMMLVGVDAEGLELRMLAHYMAKYDDGAYGAAVVDGDKALGTDVHTVNQKLIRLNARESAKTWIYAYLYGAGLLKLGMVIYEDMTGKQREAFNAKHKPGKARESAIARLGQTARRRVEEGLPALKKLQTKIQKLAKKGYLPALDGGRIVVRSAHAALNTLLQGNGSLVMKLALVIMCDKLREAGWKLNHFTGTWHRGEDRMGFVANVHDEFQMEVTAHLADEIGEMGKAAITEAGVQFGLRCPLAGSCDKGLNWAETH